MVIERSREASLLASVCLFALLQDVSGLVARSSYFAFFIRYFPVTALLSNFDTPCATTRSIETLNRILLCLVMLEVWIQA